MENICYFNFMFSIEQLPNNLEELKKLFLKTFSEKEEILDSKEEQLKIKDTEIHRLNELVRFFKRRQFGTKSEAVSSDQLGLGIFNESPEAEPSNESVEIKSYKRGKRGRKPLPKDLITEQEIIDIAESEKICGCCGERLNKIGQEKSQQLEIIPAQFKIHEIIRPKYACVNSNCDQGIKIAPPPKVALPKSIASASLLAYIMVSKFCDHLPFYRLSTILDRFGVLIGRGSMAAWMIKVADLLQPLFNLLHEKLLEGDYLGMDETRVQVLKECGKSAQSKSYMWVYGRDGPPGESIVLFEYDPHRNQDVPKRILVDYSGYLQADGYDAYNLVCSKGIVIRVGCMAHVKRKFYDAWIEAKKTSGYAQTALIYIKRLYKIEQKIKYKSAEEILNIRQAKSKLILTEMKSFIDETITKIPASNQLGKALHYAKNEWKYLSRYIEDGRINIDNNFIEREIRPFAIGRKNWLFSDSVAGVKAAAIIYSITRTAIANGLEPFAYFTHVLREIPKAKTVDDYENLLPLKNIYKT